MEVAEAPTIDTQELNLNPEAHDRDLHAFYRASFQHSQGDQELQETLFIWAHKTGILKQFNIPDELPTFISANFKMPTQHINREATKLPEYSTGAPWRGLYAIINNEELYLKGSEPQKRIDHIRNSDTNTVLLAVIAKIIARDEKYQAEERPGRTQPTVDDGPQDPHASFFRYFVLLDHKVGNPIFQKLYDQMRETTFKYKNSRFGVFDLRERHRQNVLMRKINILASKWELNHPGQQFFDIILP